VRWSNLTVEEGERATLPGYREPAVVRHFDAPEALDTRFYEVRAKSALNRVPDRSSMPFRWTVNPYRGCSHACVYCVSGDARVLRADGRQTPMRDVRAGDRIYGTERRGRYRRFVVTEVLDHWQVIKPAYRVRFSDGGEIVAGGDHRFLSARGWKHVVNTPRSAPDRPHLTEGTELLGLGPVVDGSAPTRAYRRGYLCGIVRGDGHLATHGYRRRGGAPAQVHQFRLALADLEALRRAKAFLEDEAVATTEFAFAEAVGSRRAIRAIRTQARDRVDRVRDLITWPLDPPADWLKGFLAGIFDAEGSCSVGVFRIATTDGVLLGWTVHALRRFGFDVVVERTGKANGLFTVRLRGGVAEQQRFFQLTDPAITRKRSIEGKALKTGVRRTVVGVEPLGVAMPLYDVTTGTGDFVCEGVVSHNCFARPTHQYLDLDPGRDFEREIVVKVNVPEVLAAELRRPSWTREHVAMGTNTDPYQWVEGRYRLMPGIWEALRDTSTPCSVLTKSPLLLRDVGLMQEVAGVTQIAANLSIPTIDEKAWRATEPHTPNPRARMEAVAELNRAGIPAGILVAPLMPGINDDPRQVEEILALAADAGATSVGGITLHLRGEVRGIFLDWLRSHRPDLVPRYEELYARGAYAPPEQRRRHAELLRRGAARLPVPPRRDHRRVPDAEGSLRRDPAPGGAGAARPPAEPAQGALF
jgi:DNA repair photolyase